MALVVIDSLEFDTTLGATAKIIHISGDVYAIAYRGADNAGLLKTVSINSAGDIGSVLDTLIIDATYGTPGNIIHLSGDIYAIAYQGPDSVGWLATVEIDSAGDITDPVVDSQEFDILSGVSPRIIHISGTTYAITYAKAIGTGNKWRLWLKTISIADNGTIGAEVDSLEHDTGSPNALGSNIIHVFGDIYAIAHCSHIGGGWYRTCITTVDIDSVGNIDAVVEKYEIAVDSYYPIRIGRIIHIAGVVYAVVAGVYSPNGVFLYTFDISNAGDVGAIIASLEINLTHYQWSIPDIIKLPTDYAVACTDSGQYGRFKTIVIDDDGTIGEVTGILLFQVDKAHSPYMVSIASGITGIVYSGPDSDGWMKTIGVTPTVTTQAVTNILGTTATGNGTVTDLGYPPNLTQHGHCWSTSPNPTTADDKTELGAKTATGAFTSSLTGLNPGTLYYCRAYATNSVGTSYGADRTFTTTPAVISRAFALAREEL
ncbi:hypothetical protein ES705_30444 [subsurface metagenome]